MTASRVGCKLAGVNSDATVHFPRRCIEELSTLFSAERLGRVGKVRDCIDHGVFIVCRAKPNKPIGPTFDVILLICRILPVFFGVQSGAQCPRSLHLFYFSPFRFVNGHLGCLVSSEVAAVCRVQHFNREIV